MNFIQPVFATVSFILSIIILLLVIFQILTIKSASCFLDIMNSVHNTASPRKRSSLSASMTHCATPR